MKASPLELLYKGVLHWDSYAEESLLGLPSIALLIETPVYTDSLLENIFKEFSTGASYKGILHRESYIKGFSIGNAIERGLYWESY